MNIRTLLIAATALSAMAGSAFAQSSATANVPVQVRLLAPITVASTGTALDFGTITRTTGAAGTVTVASADAGRTATGAGITLSGGTVTKATVTVGGTASAAFTLTASDANLGTGLDVEPIFSGGTDGSGSTAGSLSIGAGGTLAVDIGGKLTIATGAVPNTAAQTGTMLVTVSYN